MFVNLVNTKSAFISKNSLMLIDWGSFNRCFYFFISKSSKKTNPKP